MPESQSSHPEHQAKVSESDEISETRDGISPDEKETPASTRSSLKDFGVFNLGIGILIAVSPLFVVYSSYMSGKPIEQPSLLAIPLVIGAVLIGLAVIILRKRSAWAIKLLMAVLFLSSLVVLNSPRIGPLISTAVLLFLYISTGIKALKEIDQAPTTGGA